MNIYPVVNSRQGTILIIVAGLSALLASMSLVFLTRMRSDVSETIATMQQAQARIMLSAACMYLQEASRLGYDRVPETRLTKADNMHPEGYGWIDVRDGFIGPKSSAISALDSSNTNYNHGATFGSAANGDYYFPVGSIKRCEMHVLEIPPFAISLNAAPNPISLSVGLPFLSKPDPIPVLAPKNYSSPTEEEFRKFELGDPRIRVNSAGISWFRLFRLGPIPHPNFARNYPVVYKQYSPATFIVTCGSGGTAGYRDWNTMTIAEKERFGGDNASAQGLFAALQSEEYRSWYLVEWSAAVAGQFHFNLNDRRLEFYDADKEFFVSSNYAQFHRNVNRVPEGKAQGGGRNQGGTISLVQKLLTEPPEW